MSDNERFLKKVSGNLYDSDSEACSVALEELRDLLLNVGFTVYKKAVREATLRVYPTKPATYPLLNPCFVEKDQVHGAESLTVHVLSRKDNGGIDRQLATFTSTPACSFVAYPAGSPKYYRHHGDFILPLNFSGEPGAQEIDFASLRAPLTQILHLLRQPA